MTKRPTRTATHIAFRCSKALAAALDEAARGRGVTPSQMIRLAVIELLARDGLKHPKRRDGAGSLTMKENRWPEHNAAR